MTAETRTSSIFRLLLEKPDTVSSDDLRARLVEIERHLSAYDLPEADRARLIRHWYTLDAELTNRQERASMKR